MTTYPDHIHQYQRKQQKLTAPKFEENLQTSRTKNVWLSQADYRRNQQKSYIWQAFLVLGVVIALFCIILGFCPAMVAFFEGMRGK